MSETKMISRRFKRIAIANRGEVAVRIIRACEELGIESVLLHSEVDVNTRAYRMATHRVCVGPAPTNESYLKIESNILAAQSAGAEAVHPGFGFLSENADFAEACEKAGLVFIGPPAAAIRKLGDKVQAKELAQKIGLPLVPGYQGANQDVGFLIGEAKKIGFPVIVKAAAGGGGRGMKVLRTEGEAQELIESAQREALSAFGSPTVFLEKYLENAKHIEFQVFVDCSGRVLHLFDRECSVQRRHQKIIEEAMSPSLTPELRQKMGQAACLIVEAAGYKGAGTVEFLFQDQQFYLLEVNTRLQVEHTVTEMIMGVDLVKAQIRTAENEPVFPVHLPLAPRGHAIECRIYAEDPELGGVPSTGMIGYISWPEGPGRRFDYGFDAGDEVTSFYDSMIAKIIVWDENRPRALQKMVKVLEDSVVFGVKTNIPLLKEIILHPEFSQGTMTTRFMEQYFSKPLKRVIPVGPEKIREDKIIKEALRVFPKGQAVATRGLTSDVGLSDSSPFNSPWRAI